MAKGNLACPPKLDSNWPVIYFWMFKNTFLTRGILFLTVAPVLGVTPKFVLCQLQKDKFII